MSRLANVAEAIRPIAIIATEALASPQDVFRWEFPNGQSVDIPRGNLERFMVAYSAIDGSMKLFDDIVAAQPFAPQPAPAPRPSWLRRRFNAAWESADCWVFGFLFGLWFAEMIR